MFLELDVLELIAGTTESKLASRAAKVSMLMMKKVLCILKHVAVDEDYNCARDISNRAFEVQDSGV